MRVQAVFQYPGVQMNQTLSAYRIFYEVARTGNISKAAKAMAVSQPAISKTIARLEEQSGIRLFDRSSRGVRLTPEGELLYSYVDDAFGYIEKGEDELRRIKEFNVGHLRIGSSTTLCRYLLLPYLKDFLKDYPHMKISISNEDSIKVMKDVEGRRLDVGAVVLTDTRGSCRFLKILDVEDIFVCTPEYLRNLRLLEGEDVDIMEHGNIMLLDKDNLSRKHIDEYFREQGIAPRRMLEISTMDLLIDFAKIGLGIAAVIKEFVAAELRDGVLIEVPMKAKVRKRQAGFAYLETNKNEALKSFLQSAG